MFQFRRFPSHTYLIQYGIPCGGFPHSEISGSMLICSSPKLIAAYHVLHRLLMPRHSPCALFSLTFPYIAVSKSTKRIDSPIWFSIIVELCRLIRILFSQKLYFYPCRFYYMKTCKTFSLLLPSHNCIIIHNVQFSRCI